MTKPTKWHVHPAKTQISLASASWSESLLSPWRNLGSLATPWAHSKDSDQTGWMPRLIWVFTGHTCHFVGFVMRWLIYSCLLVINWLFYDKWALIKNQLNKFCFYFLFTLCNTSLFELQHSKVWEDTQEMPQSQSTVFLWHSSRKHVYIILTPFLYSKTWLYRGMHYFSYFCSKTYIMGTH